MFIAGRQGFMAGANIPSVTNFTWDPTKRHPTLSLTTANLKVDSGAGGGDGAVFGTVGKSSGKWYFEVKIPTNCTFGTDYIKCGVSKNAPNNSTVQLESSGNYIAFKNTLSTISLYFNGSYPGSTGIAWASGQVIAFALDIDGGTFQVYQNNVLSAFNASGLSAGTYFPVCELTDSGSTFFDLLINQTNTYAAPPGFSVWA